MFKHDVLLLPYDKLRLEIEYFYYGGMHYLHTKKGYFVSHSLNEYGLVSMDKKRCFYEKTSKKEFLKKREELDLYLKSIGAIKEKIQLLLFS